MTNGVRAYSTAVIATCAASFSLGGRLLTASSSLPAASALMPPLLPMAGCTSTLMSGWALMNALASNCIPPTPLPVPLTRTVSPAVAARARPRPAKYRARRRKRALAG